ATDAAPGEIAARAAAEAKAVAEAQGKERDAAEEARRKHEARVRDIDDGGLGYAEKPLAASASVAPSASTDIRQRPITRLRRELQQTDSADAVEQFPSPASQRWGRVYALAGLVAVAMVAGVIWWMSTGRQPQATGGPRPVPPAPTYGRPDDAERW